MERYVLKREVLTHPHDISRRFPLVSPVGEPDVTLVMKTEVLTEFVARSYELHRRLDHPGIVKIVDGFSTVAENGQLQWNTVYPKYRQDMPDAFGREQVVALVSALGYLEAHGIRHNDIKSDNIVWDHLTNPPRPILIDFGLAEREVSAVYQDRYAPGYRAPELWTVNHHGRLAGIPTTDTADVWALGVVLYELLTSRKYFTSKIVASLTEWRTNPNRIVRFCDKHRALALMQIADADWRELVSQMLAPVDDRPTARELLSWSGEVVPVSTIRPPTYDLTPAGFTTMVAIQQLGVTLQGEPVTIKQAQQAVRYLPPEWQGRPEVVKTMVYLHYCWRSITLLGDLTEYQAAVAVILDQYWSPYWGPSEK